MVRPSRTRRGVTPYRPPARRHRGKVDTVQVLMERCRHVIAEARRLKQARTGGAADG